MNTTNYRPGQFRQTNAFAMNYAVLFGLYWIAGLACFVNSFNIAGASFGFMLVIVTVPFLGMFLVNRFRKRVCGGLLTFTRGYMFSLLLYFYAALLLAVGVYLHFEFLDGGSFFNSYMAYLDSPEVKRLFETGGMEQLAGGISLKDMKNIAEAFQDLSAVAIAANILDFSIFSGLIISLPTALLAMRRPKL